jgi:hypothetical protein
VMAGVGSFFVRAYWLLWLAELARHTTENPDFSARNQIRNIQLSSMTYMIAWLASDHVQINLQI